AGFCEDPNWKWNTIEGRSIPQRSGWEGRSIPQRSGRECGSVAAKITTMTSITSLLPAVAQLRQSMCVVKEKCQLLGCPNQARREAYQL
ncbi:unnamed protein product, partial [Laminaria digitata]